MELFIGRLERLGVFRAFVPCYPPQIDRLRRRLALRIFRYYPLQFGKRFVEPVQVKVDLGDAQHHGRDELLGRQEADHAVMLLAAFIQRDDAWGPFYIEILCIRLCVGQEADRDHSVVDEPNYVTVGVRNRTHLLAADSVRVEEIEQDGFLLRLGPRQGRIHLFFPLYFRHGFLLITTPSSSPALWTAGVDYWAITLPIHLC